MVKEEVKKTIPCFSFTFNNELDNLHQAVLNVARDAGPILIEYKDLDDDLNRIKNAIRLPLDKHNVYIAERFFFEDYEDQTVTLYIRHRLSGDSYERVDILLRTTPSEERINRVKYSLIQGYISLLGLSTYSKKNNDYMVDYKSYFNITFSAIKVFLDCRKCFQLMYSGLRPQYSNNFEIQNIYDVMMKKEFDVCRKYKKIHPILEKHNVYAVPFDTFDIKQWQTFDYAKNSGLKFLDSNRNIVLSGIIDDVLIDSDGKLIVIDFKTNFSNKSTDMIKEDATIQLSLYALILKKLGYPLSDYGYIVLSNPIIDNTACTNVFSRKSHAWDNSEVYRNIIEFKPSLIKIKLDDALVYPLIDEIINFIENKPVINDNIRCKNCINFLKRKKLSDDLSRNLSVRS